MSKYRPKLKEILARIYRTDTSKWSLSFDEDGVSFCRHDHPSREECEWHEASSNQIERMEAIMIAEHEGVSVELMNARTLTQEAYDRVIGEADALLNTMNKSPHWTKDGQEGAKAIVDALREHFTGAAATMTFRKHAIAD